MVLLCFSNEILKLINWFEYLEEQSVYAWILKKDLNILRNSHDKSSVKCHFLIQVLWKTFKKNVYMLLQMIGILSSRNFPFGCFLM